MTEITPFDNLFEAIKDKVVVLTGGAHGIGAATVKLFHAAGAKIVFGDKEVTGGEQLARTLNTDATSDRRRVYFAPLDVRTYSSQLALFDLAYSTFGRVDVAVSCAAVGEPGGWFEPENLNLQTIRKEPVGLQTTIDINLTSVLAFTRLALAYMTADKASTQAQPQNETQDIRFTKSIVLVSSIAGITESPGLFAYSSAKHGVIGLMRALRPWAPLRYGVRTNAICPWATDTQLLAGVKKKWLEANLPLNEPEDVARMIVHCAADANLNGKAIFVGGGRGFDTEEGYNRTLPQWLGEENARVWLRGQDVLGLGDDWT